ncbi:hypothetical protein QQZ08_012411 [Neonectria magnoliae]|uniref:SNF2 N-terminal domain-containing protein n=1 Tax=Neonectria magnoliae TaxID=2732573 RepID=A0ABR1H280_9HYPO
MRPRRRKEKALTYLSTDKSLVESSCKPFDPKRHSRPDACVKTYNVVTDVINQAKFDWIIADEAHVAKKLKGSYHHMLGHLQWDSILWVTGTPLAGSLKDLLSPLRLMWDVYGIEWNPTKRSLGWLPGLSRDDYGPYKLENVLDNDTTVGMFARPEKDGEGMMWKKKSPTRASPPLKWPSTMTALAYEWFHLIFSRPQQDSSIGALVSAGTLFEQSSRLCTFAARCALQSPSTMTRSYTHPRVFSLEWLDSLVELFCLHFHLFAQLLDMIKGCFGSTQDTVKRLLHCTRQGLNRLGVRLMRSRTLDFGAMYKAIQRFHMDVEIAHLLVHGLCRPGVDWPGCTLNTCAELDGLRAVVLQLGIELVPGDVRSFQKLAFLLTPGVHALAVL